VRGRGLSDPQEPPGLACLGRPGLGQSVLPAGDLGRKRGASRTLCTLCAPSCSTCCIELRPQVLSSIQVSCPARHPTRRRPVALRALCLEERQPAQPPIRCASLSVCLSGRRRGVGAARLRPVRPGAPDPRRLAPGAAERSGSQSAGGRAQRGRLSEMAPRARRWSRRSEPPPRRRQAGAPQPILFPQLRSPCLSVCLLSAPPATQPLSLGLPALSRPPFPSTARLGVSWPAHGVTCKSRVGGP
jgi:hypothetical protein